jgi:hypothetical protein
MLKAKLWLLLLIFTDLKSTYPIFIAFWGVSFLFKVFFSCKFHFFFKILVTELELVLSESFKNVGLCKWIAQ